MRGESVPGAIVMLPSTLWCAAGGRVDIHAGWDGGGMEEQSGVKSVTQPSVRGDLVRTVLGESVRRSRRRRPLRGRWSGAAESASPSTQVPLELFEVGDH
jgi:hypothetical protein